MRVRILCCAAALVACITPRSDADQWDKLTYLTFSGAVQVPGATLAPGTYTFKLLDVTGNRHIVQILNKQTNKPIALLMTIPDERLEPSNKSVVMFAERPSGSPPAVKAWFYPGSTSGDEFVYPRTQAVRIAKSTHQRVLSMPDESASNRDRMKKVEVNRVDETGKADSSTSPSEEGHVAENREPASAGTPGAARGARHRLPQTASALELVELLSGLSLAAGFGVRMLRKRLGV